MELLPLTTPGEILKEEFLDNYRISQYRLAQETGISQKTISKIISGKSRITRMTAKKLGKFFGTSYQMWLNLQNQYEDELEQREGEDVSRGVKPVQSSLVTEQSAVEPSYTEQSI